MIALMGPTWPSQTDSCFPSSENRSILPSLLAVKMLPPKPARKRTELWFCLLNVPVSVGKYDWKHRVAANSSGSANSSNIIQIFQFQAHRWNMVLCDLPMKCQEAWDAKGAESSTALTQKLLIFHAPDLCNAIQTQSEELPGIGIHHSTHHSKSMIQASLGYKLSWPHMWEDFSWNHLWISTDKGCNLPEFILF